MANKWIEITRNADNHLPLHWFAVLATACLLITIACTAYTAAWRQAEARIGMLRDLPAGVLHVERKTGRILGASDRAEELLGRRLPSFAGHGSLIERFIRSRLNPMSERDRTAVFWDSFEKFGFTVDSEVAVFCDDVSEQVTKKRDEGLSSKYWVCLRRGGGPAIPGNWLEVIGTPELHATKHRPMSFSLITKPDSQHLQAILEQHRERWPPCNS